MRRRLNELFNYCLVLFLIYPSAVVAEEVWEWERFDDSTLDEAFTITGDSYNASYDDSPDNDWYGTGGNFLSLCHEISSNCNKSYEFTFSTDIKVYEVGFEVGAVNSSYEVKWYFSDGTDETEQKSAQNNSDLNNMFDTFYKSFTDYNNNEANTDIYITKFIVTLNDWSSFDDFYWQYDDELATGNFATTTTTSSTTTTTTTTTTLPPTTTTSTTTTTTTTTIPPTEEELNFAETGKYETNSERKAREEREAEEASVNQAREWERDKNFQETGIRELDSERREREAIEKEKEETAIRDEQRKANEEKYGCYMTDAQIERGDCEIPEEEPKEEIIIIEDEEKPDTKEELPNDDVVVLEVESKDEDKEFIEPLKEEVIEPTEEELEEIKFEEVKKEVEEFIEEIVIEEEVIEIPEEIIVVIEEEEIIEDEVIEENLESDKSGDLVLPEKEVIEESDEGYVEEQVEEIVEIIQIEIVEESVTEEEKKEIIEEYVEELETEEVIEIINEVNDVGVENLELVSEDVLEVVSQVVEEAIEDVEELTEEQVEVVAEVLSVKADDVEIIAETAKEDEVIQEAVEVFVERAVENAEDSIQPYTFADVVVEVQFEKLKTEGLTAIIDTDLSDIDVRNIGSDMTDDQREKSAEVVLPTIIVRIASLAFRRFA